SIAGEETSMEGRIVCGRTRRATRLHRHDYGPSKWAKKLHESMDVEHVAEAPPDWTRDFTEGDQVARMASTYYKSGLTFIRIYASGHDWQMIGNGFGLITGRRATATGFYKVTTGERAGQCFSDNYVVSQAENNGQWSKPGLQDTGQYPFRV